MKKLLSVLLGMCVFGSVAFADQPSDFYLGQPGYGGNGCPQNTVNATLSPDGKQLSILFDSYITQAGYIDGTSRQMDRKTCSLTIPIHIPQGWSVSVYKVDYRGFTAIPSGAYARFRTEYFWAGMRGPSYTKTWAGPNTGDFFLSNTLQANAFVWSACGADVNMRINTDMFVQTNSRYDQTMASLDSVDIDSGLVYQLQWRRCN